MKKLFVCFCMIFMFSSCSQLFTSVPYIISGEMKLNEEKENEFCVFDFQFKNCGDKDIYAFTVSFFLFDEEGNPVINGNPKITGIIREDVPAGEILESSYSLDNFLNFIPETPYKVEYLYVKKIVYTDGTEWTDPVGLKAMKETL